MKTIILSLLAAAATALALPAAAQVGLSSVYAGGSLGQSSFTDACSGIASCDDKDSTWGLFAGYQINRTFAAELGYHDLGAASAPGATFDATAWELVGVAAWPLGAQFSVYGKLGAFYGEAKSGGDKENTTDLTYGLGVQYDLNRNLGLRAEWQRYPNLGGDSLVETDVDALRLAALWRFQ